MKFSPTVIAREIEAQSRRLHKLITTGPRGIDLRIIRNNFSEVQAYQHPPRDDLQRLCVCLIPSGRFLGAKPPTGFTLGVVPTRDAPTEPDPEVDAIFARRVIKEEEQERALPLWQSPRCLTRKAWP